MMLSFSRLGLGTNQFGSKIDAAEGSRVIGFALDHGVTCLDTAPSYAQGESERIIGAALKRSGRRTEAVIATKFSPQDDPLVACEASLERLQTDYVDVYQMHAPNPAVPIETTLKKLSRLIEQGKVRTIGSSNFAAWQVVEADWCARVNGFERFQTVENRYNLLEREAERELVPACRRHGLGLIPYFPLAAGMLSGKYRRGEPVPENARLSGGRFASQFLTDAMFDKVEALEQYAAEIGVPLLSLAIGVLAAMPCVISVITGVTSLEQLESNLTASRWEPSPEELEKLLRITF
jgi:aryl-alcohol dehydrogenase-like predicted oxidoreductase